MMVCIACLFPVGSFSQTVNRFDIVIDEIFPDPSPVIGLPNSEFVELKNNSNVAISLRNWKLTDGSSTATIAADFILQPDSFVIICPNTALSAFRNFGNTIGVSNFPSLNNDADKLFLYSPDGKTIHAVEYSIAWYQNDVKREGGWTLEMIDTRNACAGISNWKASTDPSGGTPGRKNTVDGINPDDISPALIRTHTRDSTTIIAVFDEPVDSLSASTTAHYTIDKGIGTPIAAIPITAFPTQVELTLRTPVKANFVYHLSVSNIPDCAGNPIGIFNTVQTGLPESAGYFDIVINEILFNPPPDGYDYIEIYNRSNKIIDLQQLYIANRNTTGSLSNIQQLSDKPYLFFPGEYGVLTENSFWLRTKYLVKNPANVFELSSLPSLPDDKGHIAIANRQGEIIDHLAYEKQWHFALIDDDEGVSLERINYNDSTQNRHNWTSAASTAAFGTPGTQNSQFRADLSARGSVIISPQLFSPDNSGADDFTTIHCRMTEPGYVINITIFDVHGRPVRHLVRNATIGLSSNFVWDGTNNEQKKLPIGNYIILTEIFNLQGKTKKIKNVVTLGRRL